MGYKFMYFTDKFPKAELKLVHAGLEKGSPGKRQPVIHKNVTSNDFQFLSKVYSDMAFSRYANLSQEPPSRETLQQIFELQSSLREKDQKIKDAQRRIQNSRSLANVYKSKEDIGEYVDGLKGQIKEKQLKKIEEKVNKDQEVLKRLKEQQRVFNDEEQNRRKEMMRVMNYKNILESQKNLKKNLEFSQSQVFPGLRGSQKNLFADRKFEFIEIPGKKNDNGLTVGMSGLPEFYQTKYTKKHPKVMKRNPITGESE